MIISLDKGLRDHEFFGRWQRSVLVGSEGVDTAELLRLSCLDYLPSVCAFVVWCGLWVSRNQAKTLLVYYSIGLYLVIRKLLLVHIGSSCLLLSQEESVCMFLLGISPLLILLC